MARPRPQPTAMRILRGNPGRRPINAAEPQFPTLSEQCPPDLTSPAARAEWDRLAPLLIRCGVVTVADRGPLIGYCLKYAQWQALEAEAAQHPYIVKSPNGYPIPNPALCLANKAFNLMLKAAIELGITPSARSRIIAQPPEPLSKWAGKLA